MVPMSRLVLSVRTMTILEEPLRMWARCVSRGILNLRNDGPVDGHHLAMPVRTSLALVKQGLRQWLEHRLRDMLVDNCCGKLSNWHW